MTQTFVRVQTAEPGEGYTAIIHFTDGSCHEIDLAPYLRGSIFEPVRNDPEFFRSMLIEEGTIAWPNGADIDPDVLHYGLTPAWDASDAAVQDEEQLL